MKRRRQRVLISSYLHIILFSITVLSFLISSNCTNATEMSGYQIDKSSSGGGRVDRIDIISSTLNFGATEGTVTLDGTVANFNDWSTGKIGSIVVPSHVEGVADVLVTTADGTQLNIGSFVINPKIISASPSPAYVGQDLVISGEGFRELADCSGIITGDGSKIDVSSWSSTRIVARLVKNQPLGIGQHSLIVKSCGNSTPFSISIKQAVCNTEEGWACSGWSSCQANGYKTRTCTQENTCDNAGTPPITQQNCKFPPIISSYSPSKIHVGSAVIIIGSNFGDDCTVNDRYCGVQVNKTLVKVSSSDWSDNSIKFILPSSAADGYFQHSGYFQVVDTKG